MDQRFTFAIEAKRVLSVRYDGRWRDFEPYLYGQFSSGRDVVFGWQASGGHEGWRTLYRHRIERLTVTQQTFQTVHQGYECERPCGLVSVYAESILPSHSEQQLQPEQEHPGRHGA